MAWSDSPAWDRYCLTAVFNNMWTLKFKAQPANAFFATVNQMFGGSCQLPTILSELCSTIWFDYHALSSSWKLGGAAEHLIDGSERSISQLSFEFLGPHVIERRSNTWIYNTKVYNTLLALNMWCYWWWSTTRNIIYCCELTGITLTSSSSVIAHST